MSKQLYLFNHPSDTHKEVIKPAAESVAVKDVLVSAPAVDLRITAVADYFSDIRKSCPDKNRCEGTDNICSESCRRFAQKKFNDAEKLETVIIKEKEVSAQIEHKPQCVKNEQKAEIMNQKEKVCYKCGHPNKNTLEKPEGIICYGCLTQYHIEEMHLSKEEPTVEICPEHAEFKSYLVNTESNIDSFLTKYINTGGKDRDFILSKIMDPALSKELGQRGWDLINKFDQEIFRRGVEVENNSAVSQMFRESKSQKEIEIPKKLTPDERKEVCVHAERCQSPLKCSDECKNRPDREPIKL